MKVTVCIGSSCFIKGSREIIESLQEQIANNGLENNVELGGAFCMNNCQNGVCVSADGKIFSLTPSSTLDFFNTEILEKL